MAIDGRTPKACFDKFKQHLGPVIAATLGATHSVHRREDATNPNRFSLVLGPPSELAGIRLKGSRGDLYFSLRQTLKAVQQPDKNFRLKTRAYRYAIAEDANELTEAFIRWEYAVRPAGKTWCAHHVQIGRRDNNAHVLQFNGQPLDLNKVHTPTGFVLIENVLRFLLSNDIGVKPATTHWETVLATSERAFFEDFSR